MCATSTCFGRFDGRRLVLSFTLVDDGFTDGPFRRASGRPGEVQQCRQESGSLG
jgi:hypothetical protein